MRQYINSFLLPEGWDEEKVTHFVAHCNSYLAPEHHIIPFIIDKDTIGIIGDKEANDVYLAAIQEIYDLNGHPERKAESNYREKPAIIKTRPAYEPIPPIAHVAKQVAVVVPFDEPAMVYLDKTINKDVFRYNEIVSAIRSAFRFSKTEFDITDVSYEYAEEQVTVTYKVVHVNARETDEMPYFKITFKEA